MLANFKKSSNSGSFIDVFKDFKSSTVDLLDSKQIYLNPRVLNTVEVIKPK